MEIERNSNSGLFDRVVMILENARANIVRSVNHNMVFAYWLIGREIVVEIQEGAERAEYGKHVVEDLSKRLNARYGKGFSTTNLWYFRQFYLAFNDRLSILHPAGGESSVEKKHHPPGGELSTTFNPALSWSHYRALMRVTNLEARDFYESEAAECGWSKSQLERQIHSCYFDRILVHRGKEGLLPQNHEKLPGDISSPVHILKSPYVLEFLDLPDSPSLHETEIEQAIINNLQSFLLELGKGFSFVARQKHICFDGEDYYIDLVFYNYILKCFLLIDLKIGRLTHSHVGQMDGYVRLFEDMYRVEGDNPTIGLILCSDKSEAVAKYSVLKDRRQIFASKYMRYLPTEEDLKQELERERRLIELRIAEQ